MIGFIEIGTTYLEQFTYLAIFLFLVLNGTGFFPFPEEITLLIAGYILSLGAVKINILIPLVIVAIAIADSIYFVVGKFNPNALKKVGKYTFLSKPIIDKITRFFKNHGAKTVFLTRFIMGTRIPTAFIAASTGMKYKTYFFYDLAGIIIWSTLLISVGYMFGAYIDQIIVGLKNIKHMTFALLILLLSAWLVYHYFKHLLNPKRTRF